MPKYRTTPEAFRLLHEGQLALAEVEAAGVRVDKAYLDKAIADADARVARLEERIRKDQVFKTWKRVYGDKMNLSSRPQMERVLFDEMGFKSEAMTEKGARRSTSKSALDKIDIPFTRALMEIDAARHAKSHNLIGIRREMVRRGDDWFIHPHFHLNTAATFRSSSSDPNWQANPVRNPEVAAMVRPCFIPRRGHYILEIDYAQIEVRGCACYSEDSNLIAYCTDKTKDMHGDMARRLFLAPAGQITKALRHVAKNRFVFPQFYGDWYASCAKEIWGALERQKLCLADGTPVIDHLRKKGIRGRGDCNSSGGSGYRPSPGYFDHHVKEQQDWFWGPRQFEAHADWKERWYEQYLREGGFIMKTGFAVYGLLARNDVTNYPVQGSCFHCMLWSLIRIVGEFRRLKMKSKVIGEIHDSIQIDAHPRELQDVIDVCCKIMTEDLMRAWRWLIVPIEVEVEVSPRGLSWHEKKEWVKGDSGLWEPKG